MDFLSRAYDLVAAELGIDRALLQPLELRIRQVEGKDRHYIASAAAYRDEERVRNVFAGLRMGCTTREIAEREGISQRRVQQILARIQMP